MSKSSKAIAIFSVLAMGIASVASAQAAPNLRKHHVRMAEFHRFHRHFVVGTVASVSGNTITIATSNNATFTIDITNAKLKDEFDPSLTLGSIQVGDKIAVTGTITNNNVTATAIRDITIAQKYKTYVGKVTAVNGSSLTVQTRKSGSVTVNAASSAMIKKAGQTAQLSDITVGTNIVATGTIDPTTNNLNATEIRILAGVRAHGFGHGQGHAFGRHHNKGNENNNNENNNQ